MLAQNFKTPSDLAITDAEFEALVKVLGMFERREIVHRDLDDESPGFNLADYHNECGSVHCIAGWADVLFKTQFEEGFCGDNAALDDLFNPMCGAVEDFSKVTTGQAAAALRNFLTRGDPCWKEAMRSR